MNVKTKLEREKETVSLMIGLYCRKKHGGKTLCPDCATLDAYARERSDKCPFMEAKTFCSNCKVHCYNEEMREKIRQVMRFSAPKNDLSSSRYGNTPFDRKQKREKTIGESK